MDRRDFLKQAGVVGTAAALPVSAQRNNSPSSDREIWIGLMRRLADPVLTHAANGTLKASMPVEQAATADRRSVTHLEAIGRLLAGLAPWIALGEDDSAEGRLRAQYADLARRAIASAVDPASPDYLNFTRDRQPLVDAAFLAEGLLRAPRVLRDRLSPATKRQLVAALESTRAIVPGFNNWLLFSATVEAGLKSLGANWDRTRVDYALRQHDQWYKGDGAYGDGPEFHWDYYNSFVIHPMLVDVLDACADESPAWKDLAAREQTRAVRYAAVQERLIAPDGSFPPIGRSIAYRCGAFQALAQAALRKRLPDGVAPAQVRGALTAVIRRSLEAPDTFDANGWLRIGFCGHQPGVGETYISTGSLYLCAVGLLPLGLPASDEFWSAAPQPWTAAKAWSGRPFPIDNALRTSANRITTMTATDALKQLKALGNARVRALNAKSGAGDNQFGVSLGEIRGVAKKIRTDHPLALSLWKTANVDAQFLATLLIVPKQLSAKEMDRMVRSVSFVRVADWLISYVVRQHPEKEALRRDWMAADDRWAARAGWDLTAERVAKSPDGLDVPALLARIESEMADAKPEVQWTMNNTLATIGIHFPKHRKRAIAIGERLGIYRDYPVSKGCTSPFAPIWINFMVSRKG